MDRPDVHELTGELYDAISPGQTLEQEMVAATAADWETLWFCDALSMPLHIWWELSHGDNEPWDTLLDPQRTPAEALPYLAQFVGLEIQPSWGEHQLRQEIEAPSQWARGRPGTMLDALKRTLSVDDPYIQFVEQYTSAYILLVRTLTSQTPSESRSRAALMAQKPGGIVLDYDTIAGQNYLQLDTDYASYNAVEADYDTYADVAADTP